jgi:hypothetical protein
MSGNVTGAMHKICTICNQWHGYWRTSCRIRIPYKRIVFSNNTIAFFFLSFSFCKQYFVHNVRDWPESFDYFKGFRRKVGEMFKSLERPGIRTCDPRVRCIAPLTTTPPHHFRFRGSYNYQKDWLYTFLFSALLNRSSIVSSPRWLFTNNPRRTSVAVIALMQ